MTVPVTINADLGEAVGLHAFGNDAALLELVDAANVACGMHAGDPGTMRETVQAAGEAGVAVGAHPGLPDLVGFGRRAMALDADEVRDLVRFQVGALVGFLDAASLPLHHIKPHGALYGMTSRDPALMRAVCDVAAQYDVAVFGLAGTAHEQVAAASDVRFVPELYVDLDYDADGGLIVERRPRPPRVADVRARVRAAMDRGRVTTRAETEVPVRFESVCVHSDLDGAPDVARAVREELERGRSLAR